MSSILEYASRPEFTVTVSIGILYLLLQFIFREDGPYPDFPLIGKAPKDWFYTKTRKRWDNEALDILKEGTAKVRPAPPKS